MNRVEAGRKLPQGWRWVRLGDHVTKVGSGITPPGGQASYQRSGIPLIRSQNVHMNRFVAEGIAFISPEQDEQMEGSRVLPGDILLNITGASIGRVCVVPQEVCPANVNQHVSIIRGDGSFDPAFISHFLSIPDFQKHILDSQAGATRQALTKTLIEDFRIPFPPLAEQQRIAALLNEQMATVERARAAAQVQLEAAKALPAAYLRSVFTSPEAQIWPKKPLGEVGEIVSGVALGRKLSNGGPTRSVPYLRVANVKDGHLDLSEVYEIDATEAEIEKLKLKIGDILLTEGGDPDKLGRGTFWWAELPECIHQNHIFRVRFNTGYFSPLFISYQIASPYGKAYFLAHAKRTTGIATINQKVLAAFPLMVPPLRVQNAIAKSLWEQITGADRLRRSLEKQQNKINQLPAALLRRAFAGEL